MRSLNVIFGPHFSPGLVLVSSVALLVARQTNDRKVAGLRPTKVVCITVLTGNRMAMSDLRNAKLRKGNLRLRERTAD